MQRAQTKLIAVHRSCSAASALAAPSLTPLLLRMLAGSADGIGLNLFQLGAQTARSCTTAGPEALRIATVHQSGTLRAGNARLIAAAPELLEALQLAVRLERFIATKD